MPNPDRPRLGGTIEDRGFHLAGGHRREAASSTGSRSSGKLASLGSFSKKIVQERVWRRFRGNGRTFLGWKVSCVRRWRKQRDGEPWTWRLTHHAKRSNRRIPLPSGRFHELATAVLEGNTHLLRPFREATGQASTIVPYP
jgi:hypothetical protein